MQQEERTPLRKFNNLVKQWEYERYVARGCALVEVGSGEGGDQWKAKFRGASPVICFDASLEHLKQAQERLRVMNAVETTLHGQNHDNWSNHVSFFQGDMRYASTFDKLGLLPNSVHCVSSQFSVQFSWDVDINFKRLVSWIHYILEGGGYWIGTVPDAEAIIHLCKQSPSRFKFENKILQVTIPDLARCSNAETLEPCFGREMIFALKKSIVQEGSQEFLVFWSLFESIVRERGFRVVHTALFSSFYGLCKDKLTLSEEEQQASFCNRMFVLQKKD